MSRFRDMWMSGKYAVDRKSKGEVDKRAEKEAAQLMHQLIPEPSQQLYQDLSARRGSETGKWLTGLAGEAPAAAESWVQAHAKAVDTFEEARVWIDALFEEFAGLTFGFNDRVVGTDLFVNCEKAKIVETRDEDIWYHPVVKTIQGRLATRFWCLYVKGDGDKIAIYLFPNEMTIAFKAGQISDHDSPPLLVAEHKEADGRKFWSIQGGEASLATIPPLAKELFGDLIRLASGKMDSSELFSKRNEKPKLGENVAVGYKSDAQAGAATAAAEVTLKVDEAHLHEACDLLDKVIEKELQRLYQSTSKATPGTPEADQLRREISAVTTFRSKIVDAFETFTKEAQEILNPSPEPDRMPMPTPRPLGR
ncbi:MAG: hypothetical protein JST44_25395 [Cyanobacteria bacterium SZAS LIN-5]|nr:hypothetical protein [Cyanobacteria bacterium SZAS LIN-5]RTL36109.1 MAG: hypothetical protein EKK48_27535 [Candidatus Melainabacteria bacterium]